MRDKHGNMIGLVGGAEYFLDRAGAEAEMRRVLGPQYEFLAWSGDKGAAILNAVAMTEPEGPMEHATVCLLWLYLEALDGLDVLVRAGAIGPAEVVGRTVLENGLQLLYLLKRDDPDVARAYNVERVRRNADGFAKLARGSDQRRQFIREARRSWPDDAAVWWRHPDTAQEAESLRESLKHGTSAAANAELERLGRGASWYQTFGGPRDLFELARYLDMEFWHRINYALWSDRVHGRASHTVFVLQPDGDVPLNVLRDTSGWATVVAPIHILNTRMFAAVTARFEVESAEAFAAWKGTADAGLLAALLRNGIHPDAMDDPRPETAPTPSADQAQGDPAG